MSSVFSIGYWQTAQAESGTEFGAASETEGLTEAIDTESLAPHALFNLETLLSIPAAPLYERFVYIQQLLEITLEEDPLVKQASAQLFAADENVKSAWSAFGPSLSLSMASHDESRDQPETASDTDFSGNQFTASISQPVFDFGTRYLSLRQQKLLSESAAVRSKGIKASVLAGNLRSLMSVIAEHHKVLVYERSLEIQNQIIDLQTRKVAAGGGNRSALLQAHEQREQVIGLLAATRAQRDQELNLLRVMFQVPDLRISSIAALMVRQDLLPNSLEDALALVATSPSLSSLNLQAEAEAQAAYNAIASSAPNVEFVYEAQKYSNFGGVNGKQDNSIAMLRMNWNLGPGISQVNSALSRSHNHDAAIAAHGVALREAQIRVYRAWADLEGLNIRLSAARAAFDAQYKLYSDAYNSYISGKVPLVAVLEAATPVMRSVTGLLAINQERSIRQIDLAETVNAISSDTLVIRPDGLYFGDMAFFSPQYAE